jgi:hypothetical protein
VSGGLGVALPTGRDTRLFRAGGNQILQLENESVHLLPYVAMLHLARESSLFVQGFLQFDIDANGNSISGDLAGQALQPLGTMHDATLMFADVGVGFQLYQDPNTILTAIVPTVELHYSSTLQDADSVSGAGITVAGQSQRLDVLNMTAGAHFLFGDRLVVTPGIAVPLRTGDDRQFDFEATVLANWYF